MNYDQLIELFELPQHFTREELDRSYRDLVQVWHPDKYANNTRLQLKAEEKLKEINSAYAALKEFLSRAASAPARNRRPTPGGNVGVHHVHPKPDAPRTTTIHTPSEAARFGAPAASNVMLSSVMTRMTAMLLRY